ncbi:flagellar basal body-associated FliL family protein [Candidatus Berkiella aquae]|uniref:Flagellar protein FliL n=1 Tax=Candidatus Berkiella aquae TaxID=295108 RepID=A0A0Q9YX33_9GAMM|nr:flagellar basal body-associated FliL family protein [Candidatus Berkiella aquae]MCS5711417.1 flagellar basal body-associated FliL family protein [Candidatus Berkiella aquae]
MATSEKNDENSRPNKHMLIIAGALITLMLIVMGVLVVMLLKLSAPTQQTIVVDAKGNEVSTTSKSTETVVKADPKDIKEAKEAMDAKGTADAKGGNEAKHAEKSDKKSVERPSFYKFTPAFIVNIPSNGRLRFLQVEVQLMAKNDEDVKSIESYAPLIRNDLITLFSSQNYDDLLTPDGKENLRKSALSISRKILKDNTGMPRVEQVLFTNFVTQ